MKNKYLLPILALVFAQVLWGINTPVIKFGLETVPLPIYHSVTILGAAALIFPMAAKRWKPLPLKYYVLLGCGAMLAVSVGNVFMLLGLQKITSLNASLIGLMQPIILVLLSILILKEKFRIKTFIGAMTAFAGAALILGEPWNWNGSSQDLLLGNLFLVLSVLCSVVSVLICKPVLKRADEYQVAFIDLFIGVMPVAIYAAYNLPTLDTGHITTTSMAAMTTGIFAIAAANYLFMYGLKRKRVQQVGMFSYVHPVATAFGAWIILTEVPDQKIVLGGLLICFGILISESKKIPSLPIKFNTVAKEAT